MRPSHKTDDADHFYALFPTVSVGVRAMKESRGGGNSTVGEFDQQPIAIRPNYCLPSRLFGIVRLVNPVHMGVWALRSS
jgi:hypothetical protein